MYDKDAVRKRQMLYTTIKRHMHNFNQYHCALSDAPGYVKSIFKDEKNVLKLETIL